MVCAARSGPALGDLNGDGDFDLVSGAQAGGFAAFPRADLSGLTAGHQSAWSISSTIFASSARNASVTGSSCFAR